MSLFGTSKLILVPRLNISFTNNLAYVSGGALFINDFQCSQIPLVPLECFLSIQSSDPTTENILLHFENNKLFCRIYRKYSLWGTTKQV